MASMREACAPAGPAPPAARTPAVNRSHLRRFTAAAPTAFLPSGDQGPPDDRHPRPCAIRASASPGAQAFCASLPSPTACSRKSPRTKRPKVAQDRSADTPRPPPARRRRRIPAAVAQPGEGRRPSAPDSPPRQGPCAGGAAIHPERLRAFAGRHRPPTGVAALHHDAARAHAAMRDPQALHAIRRVRRRLLQRCGECN